MVSADSTSKLFFYKPKGHFEEACVIILLITRTYITIYLVFGKKLSIIDFVHFFVQKLMFKEVGLRI